VGFFLSKLSCAVLKLQLCAFVLMWVAFHLLQVEVAEVAAGREGVRMLFIP